MEFIEKMHAVKESEDENKVIYAYGHLMYGSKMTGKLSITKSEFPAIATIQLEDGYETRANEIRMGSRIIMDHLETGIWPEKSQLV